MISMTIKSALVASTRKKTATLALALGLASAALLPAASGNPYSQQQLATSPAHLGSPLRALGGIFPSVGLAVALWATHHVRRRNARQMAAFK
jgi:hypothetical protein